MLWLTQSLCYCNLYVPTSGKGCFTTAANRTPSICGRPQLETPPHSTQNNILTFITSVRESFSRGFVWLSQEAPEASCDINAGRKSLEKLSLTSIDNVQNTFHCFSLLQFPLLSPSHISLFTFSFHRRCDPILPAKEGGKRTRKQASMPDFFLCVWGGEALHW